MKRILFINSVCGNGSTGRIVSELYRYMEESGYECVVAYGRKDAPKAYKTIKIGCNASVYLHGIISRITDLHGFYSTLSTKRLLRKIDRYNPDIIHLHNLHGYYINVKLLFEYLAERNIHVIWTLHDCWAFTGHCASFDAIGCEKWRVMCGKCPQKRAYPASFVLDSSKWNYLHKRELFTKLNSLTIVVPSVWLKERIKESFLSKYNVSVIQNGIDLTIFRPVDNDIKSIYHIEDKTVILGVANVWTHNKGLHHFLRLASQLDDAYQIILVGLTEKQIAVLPSRILGIKKTNCTEELVKFYSAADILFNASIEETMGMVTIEALACGTPVLAFNRTAIPETFDQTCGILLENDTDSDVLSAIISGEWKNISSHACRKYAEKFSKQNMYRKYLELFECM